MKKVLLFIIAALFFNVAHADPVPPRLMRNLKGFHVMKAELKKGVLKLTTNHPFISMEIYESLIKDGACNVLLNNPEKGWEKARIDRIEVLSRDERQGYALIDARKSCFEIEKIKDEDKKKSYLSEQTWICSMEICNDPAADKIDKADKGGR